MNGELILREAIAHEIGRLNVIDEAGYPLTLAHHTSMMKSRLEYALRRADEANRKAAAND